MKLAQLRIRLAILLTHRKYRDRKFKIKTVTKLANLTGRSWWLTLYIGTLIHQKYKANKYYQICKKERLMIRGTYIDMIDRGPDNSEPSKQVQKEQ